MCLSSKWLLGTALLLLTVLSQGRPQGYFDNTQFYAANKQHTVINAINIAVKSLQTSKLAALTPCQICCLVHPLPCHSPLQPILAHATHPCTHTGLHPSPLHPYWPMPTQHPSPAYATHQLLSFSWHPHIPSPVLQLILILVIPLQRDDPPLDCLHCSAVPLIIRVLGLHSLANPECRGSKMISNRGSKICGFAPKVFSDLRWWHTRSGWEAA